MSSDKDTVELAQLLLSEAETVVSRLRFDTMDNRVERIARALPRISRALSELEDYVVRNGTEEHRRLFHARALELERLKGDEAETSHSVRSYRRISSAIERKLMQEKVTPQVSLDKFTVVCVSGDGEVTEYIVPGQTDRT